MIKNSSDIQTITDIQELKLDDTKMTLNPKNDVPEVKRFHGLRQGFKDCQVLMSL